jgi:hypothetical protein
MSSGRRSKKATPPRVPRACNAYDSDEDQLIDQHSNSSPILNSVSRSSAKGIVRAKGLSIFHAPDTSTSSGGSKSPAVDSTEYRGVTSSSNTGSNTTAGIGQNVDPAVSNQTAATGSTSPASQNLSLPAATASTSAPAAPAPSGIPQVVQPVAPTASAAPPVARAASPCNVAVPTAAIEVYSNPQPILMSSQQLKTMVQDIIKAVQPPPANASTSIPADNSIPLLKPVPSSGRSKKPLAPQRQTSTAASVPSPVNGIAPSDKPNDIVDLLDSDDDIGDTIVADTSTTAMEERVRLRFQIPDTLVYPYNNQLALGNWIKYCEKLTGPLQNPSPALVLNVEVMCNALHLLQEHAYKHDDILAACEILTGRVAQMVNAASSGNSAETYKKFEPLLPRLCQTHVAFGMIPPQKIKGLHAHSKMMTTLAQTDTKSGSKRSASASAASQHTGASFGKKRKFQKQQNQNQNQQHNASGSRPTSNNSNGSSSAAASQ